MSLPIQKNAGNNFYYGMRMRPCGGGAVPKSFSSLLNKEQALDFFKLLRDSNNVRHGVIIYPIELSIKEISSFELVPLDKAAGIESIYLNTIPKNELEKDLIEILAIYFLKNYHDYSIEEISYDSEFELKEAFKNTAIFANRKQNIELFNNYKRCLMNLSYQAVISRLIDLRKLAA